GVSIARRAMNDAAHSPPMAGSCASISARRASRGRSKQRFPYWQTGSRNDIFVRGPAPLKGTDSDPGRNAMQRSRYRLPFAIPLRLTPWLPVFWLLTLPAASAAHAQASTYPDRPVTVISDAAAGSTPDV